jgi:serine-type D-Ala-D-Ala endopeptidase (penicillin-binding protein 7)
VRHRARRRTLFVGVALGLALGLGAGAALPGGPLEGVARAAARSGKRSPAKRPPGKRAGRKRLARRKKGHVFLERHVVATKGGQPNVQALGALVVDEAGHEIYARSPDKERPIASISKIAATLTIADHNIELDGLSTIEKTDIDVAKGGARSRLLDGMTLSNRDLLHAALMGSDNRAIPALGRAVKLSPSQLTNAMNDKARALGLKNTRFHEPTGLSPSNVSTPRETITMLRALMDHPVLGPITERAEYDAHPVGRPPIHYNNTDHAASRGNIQVLAGKTGYNDVARYCLVVAAKVDGRLYFMSFLANEGKLTRFGDVARVADWILSHRPKGTAVAAATPTKMQTTMPTKMQTKVPTTTPAKAPTPITHVAAGSASPPTEPVASPGSAAPPEAVWAPTAPVAAAPTDAAAAPLAPAAASAPASSP